MIFGPERYKDDNWDLNLLTLSYEEQEIDISGAEAKIFNQDSKKWENCSSNLTNVTLMDIYGKKVPLENIDSLIAYKTKTAREVDIEDVKQLKSLQKK